MGGETRRKVSRGRLFRYLKSLDIDRVLYFTGLEGCWMLSKVGNIYLLNM